MEFLDPIHNKGNLYQLLGLKSNASQRELIQAYREKSKLYHPDRNKNEENDEIMKLLNEAKEKLIDDPEARKKYDEELASNFDEDASPLEDLFHLGNGTSFSEQFREKFESYRAKRIVVLDVLPKLFANIADVQTSKLATRAAVFLKNASLNWKLYLQLSKARGIQIVPGTEKKEILNIYITSFQNSTARRVDPIAQPNMQKLQKIETCINELRGAELAEILFEFAESSSTKFIDFYEAVQHTFILCQKYQQLEAINPLFRGGIMFLKAYYSFFCGGNILECLNFLDKVSVLIPSLLTDFATILVTKLISFEPFQLIYQTYLVKDLQNFYHNRGSSNCDFFGNKLQLFDENDTSANQSILPGLLRSFRQIAVIEKYICRQFAQRGDYFEVSMSYIDASMVAPTRSARAQCLVLACRYLLNGVDDLRFPVETRIAHFMLIVELICCIIEVSKFGVLPCCSQYLLLECCHIIIAGYSKVPTRRPFIKSAANDDELFEALAEQLISSMDRIVDLTLFWPLANYQLKLKSALQITTEEILLPVVQSEILDQFLTFALNQSELWLALNTEYLILEGSFLKWLPEKDFNRALKDAMMMFDTVQYSLTSKESLSKLLFWTALPRDTNGWMLRDAPPRARLFFPPSRLEKYSTIEGFSINLERAEIKLDALQNNNFALLTSEELNFLLEYGFSGAFFSLDQPTKIDELEMETIYHPFQEVVYFPNTWKDSSCLATLLYTDYILKMLTTGVEISSDIFVGQRSAIEGDGFLTKLPPQLLKYLREPLENRTSSHLGRMHRFWIEANPVPLFTEDGDPLSFFADNPEMIVKKHLLVRKPNGDIVDDENDQEEDDSPEAEFARRFTEYYAEIAEYFPEFYRLREIAKVCAISQRLHGLACGVEEQMNTITDQECEKSIREFLSQVKQSLDGKWPFASAANIKKAVDDSLRANNTYRGDPRYAPSALTNLERDIRNSLQAEEEKHIQHIKSQLTTNYYDASITKFIRDSLSGYASSVPSVLVSSMKAKKKEPLEKILSELRRYGINAAAIKRKENMKRETLGWVPAAMNRRETESGYSMVYGGVNLLNSFIIINGTTGEGGDRGGSKGGGGGGGGGRGDGDFAKTPFMPSYGRWAPGMPIDKLTPSGNSPSWDLVRNRYWKERHHQFSTNRSPASENWKYSTDNLDRMKRGRAPLDNSGKPIEIHHNVPQRNPTPYTNRPYNLYEVTRVQHSKIDPYRRV